MIGGGLYSITALRKTGAEDKVYSRHQELKQASKQASKQVPQPIHELLVATEAVGEFFIFEESVCDPRVSVRPSVVLVLERVLPAVPGPLVAQEADEGRAPDEVGGGDSTEQTIEDREVQHLFWSSR